MAMTSGPFDSNVTYDEQDRPIYDRPYSSQNLRDLHMRDRRNGVVLIGDDPTNSSFKVVATSPASRYVNVSKGHCFIKGANGYNDDFVPIAVATAHPSLPRYDTIVLRLDDSINVRGIVIDIKQGTAAQNPSIPTLTRTNEIYELGIANIYVPAASSTVQNMHINDTRMNDSRCGLSTPYQEIEVSRFYDQIQDLIDNYNELVRHAIDDTEAGHLQGLINTINSKIPSNASASNKLMTKSSQYNVGSVILRFDNQSPGALYGGTWRKITSGRYLRAANDTNTGGNSSHVHGSYGSYNGSLSALIGASNNDIGRIAYLAGSAQIGGQYTYGINGGASRYPGAQDHNTPVVGATSSANNDPLYQDFHVWVKEAD